MRTKLLITGGAGFIGANFVYHWAGHHPDDELVVLDKLTYAGNLENLRALGDRVSFIHGDICDPAIVNKAMQGVDIVVHFAAETHVDRSIEDPSIFVRSNVLGTQVLLDAAKKHAVKRFHHVSTDEVFGQIALGSSERWTENSPYNPRSPYAASKAASDHLVRAYYHTYNLPVTISNCANNIGPFMFPEKLIPLAITNILEGKKVPVYTPGNQVREWLYVTDHCRAIETILHKGKMGETYFVGPDNPELTNFQVIQKLLVMMQQGDDMIEIVGDRPGHDQKYALDHSKITRELGWEPEVDLDAALHLVLEWYKNNTAWWQRVKSRG